VANEKEDRKDMQATITANRQATLGGARLWARLVLAVVAAVVLGFGLGYVTSPATHSAQPAVKVITVPVTGEQPRDPNAPTHGTLP
jgi:hypothetical protein